MSAKARKMRPLLDAWEEAVLRRAGYRCEARDIWPEVQCDGRPKAHHVAQRSVRKDLVLDVGNGRALCAAHHRAVHDNEPLAHERGLIRHSWEGDDGSG